MSTSSTQRKMALHATERSRMDNSNSNNNNDNNNNKQFRPSRVGSGEVGQE